MNGLLEKHEFAWIALEKMFFWLRHAFAISLFLLLKSQGAEEMINWQFDFLNAQCRLFLSVWLVSRQPILVLPSVSLRSAAVKTLLRFELGIIAAFRECLQHSVRVCHAKAFLICRKACWVDPVNVG